MTAISTQACHTVMMLGCKGVSLILKEINLFDASYFILLFLYNIFKSTPNIKKQ